LKSIRLLPVVIFAALALLLFKGIGLVTNGGYVLTGTTAVVAQEGDAAALSTPSEATLTDNSPTLTDGQPTLPAKVDAPPEGASSTSAALASSSADAGPADTGKTADVCPEAAPSASAAPSGHDISDKIGNALANGCPAPDIPVNEHGDAVPSTKDGKGKIVPLEVADGNTSEPALLQRLGERRAELDKREADLALRESLVAAAEKKLDERTKQLEDLQAQVAALVDQKQAAEDASFKAIVSMYENMKPKDAAKIFDTLDLDVLLKVARAMNPRKMSPVLALMSPEPAQALTTAFASTGPVQTAADTSGAGQNLSNLPQIVGH
jgi:flagellar motility protein MotE (MotC chaperone)